MPVRVQKWDPAWGEMTEQNMRKWLEGQGYSVSRYDYPPGTTFPDHTHAVDKIDTVLKGRFKIGTESGDFVLEPGDMIDIPAGAVHNAEVVGSGSVVSLDATRPPRSKG